MLLSIAFLLDLICFSIRDEAKKLMCQVCGQFQRAAKNYTLTMTVGRREILFADPKETERLIGRVLAGNGKSE